MKLSGLEQYFETVNDEIVDFKQVDKNNWSPLMYALVYNKENNLNLNEEQWDYLIHNSDLKQVDKFNQFTLMFVLRFNEITELNINNESIKYLIDNSDLSLINNNRDLSQLKIMQSCLLNDKILSKIDIKEETNKVKKV